MTDQPCDEVATAELVKRALDEDASAWEALIDRFSLRVQKVVRSYGLSVHDAQDAEQAVWSIFAEHLSRVRAPEHIGAWLATTTHNECRRQLRLSRHATPEDPARLDVVNHRSPEALHLAAERDRRVQRAIAGLGEPDRTVASLELYRPRSPAAEIAEFTGLHEREVPGVRRRVRRRLRRLLADEDQKGPRDEP
ncbi:MAG: sigma-70 family RNA polymerase sigma factor [Nocardiopsaceae bacterium]|mgnify:CR=1 FL=1|nr:sigma-70 family RNA polymerase sigma factor [Nocardiopsaceae bacterium]